ncbi:MULTISPECIES: YbhN family protein [unclassified Beijerinckia]|uniref:lysylphosphatidylglycerol synthase transmembrane domain-containing protein n=1 Tax=unclassified Beijerinckia TaxID=2638183 RepID=UPI000899538D|nr:MULTISPECIES: YbhN family protein [unclassified Beijerinckia]MDH7797444.1 uncharacterized membrane protein YbhN (UPF0104 family) [Beijerinckia sp. GAS462]SEC85809.1 hypothetical protein SAMN05443249_3738 [Beijerinckia sp. 28-YEA-48]
MAQDSESDTDTTNAKADKGGNGNRWLGIAGMAVSLAILGFSVYVVAQVLARLDFGQVATAIHATSWTHIALALAFGCGSYLALTFYDFIGLKQLREPVPYRTAAMGSFCAYSMSFTLGFPLLTGSAARYAIYSRVGVSAGNVARLVMLCSLQFWLGMNVLVGLALVLRAPQLAELDKLAVGINMALGWAVLGAVALWCLYVGSGARRLHIKNVALELPGLKLTLAQIVVSCCDLLCAGSALYMLLPAGHGLDFITYIAVYVFAVTAGAASNVPGGIGPFEATFLKAVPGVSAEALLAGLLLFRVVYYFGPFVIGLLIFGAHEVRARLRLSGST